MCENLFFSLYVGVTPFCAALSAILEGKSLARKRGTEGKRARGRAIKKEKTGSKVQKLKVRASKKFAFIQPLYLATKWFIRLKNEKQKKTKKKRLYKSILFYPPAREYANQVK